MFEVNRLKMVTSKAVTPATEYFSARSRTASIESRARSEPGADLAPLVEDSTRSCAIQVSKNADRKHKDKRIYVNQRTGLPIRPPTSFGLFKHAMRRNMKNGKVDFHEFNKRANDHWTRMKDEEKEPYVERAKILGQQFKRIEVSFLRKKVRELQNQVKEYRRVTRSYGRI